MKLSGQAIAYNYKRYLDFKGNWQLMNIAESKVETTISLKIENNTLTFLWDEMEGEFYNPEMIVDKKREIERKRVRFELSENYGIDFRTWKDNSGSSWRGLEFEGQYFGWLQGNESIKFSIPESFDRGAFENIFIYIEKIENGKFTGKRLNHYSILFIPDKKAIKAINALFETYKDK